MSEFSTSIDICNRGLQHVGAPRIGADGFDEDSQSASECSFVYGKLRQAELRRNRWIFSIRRAVIRPISPDMRFLSPTAYSAATVYRVGSLVTYDSVVWISNTDNHTANTPGETTQWELYAGPLGVTEWDEDTTYYAGDVAYVPVGDGTYAVYYSLVNSNTDTPSEAALWDDETTYRKGDVVDDGGTPYVSLVDLNLDNDPSSSPSQWSATTGTRGTGSLNWQPLVTTLTDKRIITPATFGPDRDSRSLYPLPASFLRFCNPDPKAGSVSFLGAPSNAGYSDWVRDGQYILTRQTGPMLVRFVADFVDVTRMDAMFCEGLACRIGIEVCETLTQSITKRQAVASEYQKFMGEARLVNAIESDTEESPLDDWISCRA